jgi:hypothetical protein
MHVLKHPPLQFFLAPAALFAAVTVAQAAPEDATCQLKINGHSIRQLTLIERTGRAGVRLDHPGQTVQLSAGTYRVESVELEDGFTLQSMPGNRDNWFHVTPEGPNELVVGAPLYPTVTARRHGGFIQMDYATVDGAGRNYEKTRQAMTAMPPAPTFTVYQDGQQIGAGSFEYG